MDDEADDIFGELFRATSRCETAARPVESIELLGIRQRLQKAIKQVEPAWSGSWIGYQSQIYIRNFQSRQPDDSFDTMSGTSLPGLVNSSRGDWVEYDKSEVVIRINELAETSEEDWKLIDVAASTAAQVFSEVKGVILTTLTALLYESDDKEIRKKRDEIYKLESHISAREIFLHLAPRQVKSVDKRATQGGIQIPPHVEVEARLLEQFSYCNHVAKLGEHIRSVSNYLRKRDKMVSESGKRTTGKIFIGHGGSAIWLVLRDFLEKRLHLHVEEFNRESTAGKSTKERLEEMLEATSFAFLVMTAEDETADGKLQARGNVIHEVGLFQGRLGFKRAIVLLEEGCEEFSNITGITQIRFSKNTINATFEDIRRVLEREKILQS